MIVKIAGSIIGALVLSTGYFALQNYSCDKEVVAKQDRIEQLISDLSARDTSLDVLELEKKGLISEIEDQNETIQELKTSRERVNTESLRQINELLDESPPVMTGMGPEEMNRWWREHVLQQPY